MPNSLFRLKSKQGCETPSDLLGWLHRIEQMHPSTIELGLGRIQTVFDRLGVSSQLTFPKIMVAGTNGKGSCVAAMEAIYRAAGYRVATYTSPHLLSYNERIGLNGEPVADAVLCDAFSRVEEARRMISLTFFEFFTLAALWVVADEQPDVALLEVGLGGRLDAVNVLDADVAVITNIAIDHTDWLGSDREAIGKEKAGIFVSNGVAVCGDRAPPDSLLQCARERNVRLSCAGQDFDFEEKTTHWDWRWGDESLNNLPKPPLLLDNASLALAAVRCLEHVLPLSNDAVCAGLSSVVFFGRFQILQDSPQVIVDVAHNPNATTQLAKRLAQTAGEGKTMAVVGMLQDKDIAGSLAPLLERVDDWSVVDIPAERAAPARCLMKILKDLGREFCYNHPSVTDALREVKARCDERDRIVVFGSFYTVAEAMRAIQNEGASLRAK